MLVYLKGTRKYEIPWCFSVYYHLNAYSVICVSLSMTMNGNLLHLCCVCCMSSSQAKKSNTQHFFKNLFNTFLCHCVWLKTVLTNWIRGSIFQIWLSICFPKWSPPSQSLRLPFFMRTSARCLDCGWVQCNLKGSRWHICVRKPVRALNTI